ncbi:oxygenase MpaB family protein [uncultured Maritimibacter sp.]|uniref:oxygenase MpaB family protein n=1 Tax=uncultured Maritimibacter sp. TaxID=991866 RepID=UPI00259840EA|nr:oxygenase MpaB family protein [uncultured Maritimibacter sp.]
MEPVTSYLGWNLDFTEPKGEPALCAPDSISWTVYKNPISLAIGGVAAVLLEFADARIRSGVWDHSVYPTDPLGRSRRTGLAAMVGIYGPESAARRVIKGVNHMHARVSGKTPTGEAYAATDVELLDWVSATAAYGFMMAYDRYVTPLSYGEKCQFYEESVPVVTLYGVKSPIRRPEDFEAMVRARLPRFEPHQINRDFLEIIKSGKAARGVPKGLYVAIANAAVGLLPGDVRHRLALGGEFDLTLPQRLSLRMAAKLANTVPAKNSPAVGAAQRLGLPHNFAWKSPAAKARILAERGQAPVSAE